jgi:acyl-coenzyme A thioesterase PaaI-like protein
MSDSVTPAHRNGHVLGELGLQLWLDGDDLHGSAEVVPEMHVPGTDCLRTSILATWVDVMTGIMCADVFDGRVPVTLDLALDLFRPAHGYRRIDAITTVLKRGRSVAVAEVRFTADGTNEVVALGSGSFVASPHASHTLPPRAENVARFGRHRGTLTEPFADRVGCRRLGSGTASLARRGDGLNASNTVNGGLLTLVVEEAVLSANQGATLSSLLLHFLRPGRVGPLVGTAKSYGDVARVEVRDTGVDDRLAIVATARTFPTR